ncbi:hypothetical protein SCLARK_00309 [Spiroplasma clarkii]|uniref:Lipoprotein n=1 Tax=Spiroplasma clarkii TaxID=2139 RepID=A0A1Y0KZA1_9MOLU|nr:hypothetical protein [Spiroplasma clarkii]ARU91066.1 hypothetical protein SCLARK_00309 [Spiroplasma clarkii]ATX70502.1 hypothetical protein SCLAR_v1c01710 [Spiroplasma clarkii]
MSGIKFILKMMPVAALTSIPATVVSCGKENNMVEVYSLDRTNGKPGTNFENSGITIIDKTKVERYSLEEALPEGICKITFYFKDGTFDNTQNKWWSGYKHQYIAYFKDILGLDYNEE